MEPVGNYKDFINHFHKRYDRIIEGNETVCFGILLADCRQTSAREYILNYLDYFHQVSGPYFDFFIPGYQRKEKSDTFFNDYRNEYLLSFRSKKGISYYFSPDEYDDFWNFFQNRFGVKRSFSPMLVLMERRRDYEKDTKIITVELEGNTNIKRSGELFIKIFNEARCDPSLKAIQEKCLHQSIIRRIFSSIVKTAFGPYISIVSEAGEGYLRYRIKYR